MHFIEHLEGKVGAWKGGSPRSRRRAGCGRKQGGAAVRRRGQARRRGSARGRRWRRRRSRHRGTPGGDNVHGVSRPRCEQWRLRFLGVPGVLPLHFGSTAAVPRC
jgi:hypothetical protein